MFNPLAIRFEYDTTKFKCNSFSESNSIGDGALFGPDQNGFPSLSFASIGKIDKRSLIV
jgi:hypothetical protein